jgi:putative NADPH-quinone reductase
LKDNGDFVPSLHNVKRLGAACTYGGKRLHTFLAGDPCRRFVTRSMRAICAPGARCDYVAHYDMNHSRPDRRAAFLVEVERRFSRW